jgi:hypothetical protein
MSHSSVVSVTSVTPPNGALQCCIYYTPMYHTLPSVTLHHHEKKYVILPRYLEEETYKLEDEISSFSLKCWP